MTGAPTPTASVVTLAQGLAAQATSDMLRRTNQREEDAVIASAARPLTRRRVSVIALGTAAPALALLIAFTFFPDALADALSPAPTPEVARAQAQAELDEVVREVEEFKADFSKLPETLVQVGAPAGGGWAFSKSAGDRYEVVRTLHGQVVSFHSAQTKAAVNEN